PRASRSGYRPSRIRATGRRSSGPWPNATAALAPDAGSGLPELEQELELAVILRGDYIAEAGIRNVPVREQDRNRPGHLDTGRGALGAEREGDRAGVAMQHEIPGRCIGPDETNRSG